MLALVATLAGLCPLFASARRGTVSSELISAAPKAAGVCHRGDHQAPSTPNALTQDSLPGERISP
jgi:hypothetical protein